MLVCDELVNAFGEFHKGLITAETFLFLRCECVILRIAHAHFPLLFSPKEMMGMVFGVFKR